MADDISVTPGTGATVAADDIGGVKYQRVKATWGPDGTANDADVATGKPLPVQVRSATGLIPIGEPTDAKSTATDTTSVSAISIWKQISASVQALVSDAFGKGTAGTPSSDVISIQGVASMTAVKTDGSATTQPVSHALLTNVGAGEYETVAASQTDQAMGATGATGDYLAGVLIVPATTSPGNVKIKDGSGSAITIFTGGADSVSNLVPFYVAIGAISGSGAWKVTTGADVSALGFGNFT